MIRFEARRESSPAVWPRVVKIGRIRGASVGFNGNGLAMRWSENNKVGKGLIRHHNDPTGIVRMSEGAHIIQADRRGHAGQQRVKDRGRQRSFGPEIEIARDGQKAPCGNVGVAIPDQRGRRPVQTAVDTFPLRSIRVSKVGVVTESIG